MCVDCHKLFLIQSLPLVEQSGDGQQSVTSRLPSTSSLPSTESSGISIQGPYFIGNHSPLSKVGFVVRKLD